MDPSLWVGENVCIEQGEGAAIGHLVRWSPVGLPKPLKPLKRPVLEFPLVAGAVFFGRRGWRKVLFFFFLGGMQMHWIPKVEWRGAHVSGLFSSVSIHSSWSKQKLLGQWNQVDRAVHVGFLLGDGNHGQPATLVAKNIETHWKVHTST